MFHANHLFLILLTLFTNVIKDVLQRFLRLLIPFFRTAQDDTVLTLSFRFVAVDTQRTVGRLELDVATQQSGFQFGLDGHNGPERDEMENEPIFEIPIVTISTQKAIILLKPNCIQKKTVTQSITCNGLFSIILNKFILLSKFFDFRQR